MLGLGLAGDVVEDDDAAAALLLLLLLSTGHGAEDGAQHPIPYLHGGHHHVVWLGGQLLYGFVPAFVPDQIPKRFGEGRLRRNTQHLRSGGVYAADVATRVTDDNAASHILQYCLRAAVIAQALGQRGFAFQIADSVQQCLAFRPALLYGAPQAHHPVTSGLLKCLPGPLGGSLLLVELLCREQHLPLALLYLDFQCRPLLLGLCLLSPQCPSHLLYLGLQCLVCSCVLDGQCYLTAQGAANLPVSLCKLPTTDTISHHQHTQRFFVVAKRLHQHRSRSLTPHQGQ